MTFDLVPKVSEQNLQKGEFFPMLAGLPMRALPMLVETMLPAVLLSCASWVMPPFHSHPIGIVSEAQRVGFFYIET